MMRAHPHPPSSGGVVETSVHGSHGKDFSQSHDGEYEQKPSRKGKAGGTPSSQQTATRRPDLKRSLSSAIQPLSKRRRTSGELAPQNVPERYVVLAQTEQEPTPSAPEQPKSVLEDFLSSLLEDAINNYATAVKDTIDMTREKDRTGYHEMFGESNPLTTLSALRKFITDEPTPLIEDMIQKIAKPLMVAFVARLMRKRDIHDHQTTTSLSQHQAVSRKNPELVQKIKNMKKLVLNELNTAHTASTGLSMDTGSMARHSIVYQQDLDAYISEEAEVREKVIGFLSEIIWNCSHMCRYTSQMQVSLLVAPLINDRQSFPKAAAELFPVGDSLMDSISRSADMHPAEVSHIAAATTFTPEFLETERAIQYYKHWFDKAHKNLTAYAQTKVFEYADLNVELEELMPLLSSIHQLHWTLNKCFELAPWIHTISPNKHQSNKPKTYPIIPSWPIEYPVGTPSDTRHKDPRAFATTRFYSEATTLMRMIQTGVIGKSYVLLTASMAQTLDEIAQYLPNKHQALLLHKRHLTSELALVRMILASFECMLGFQFDCNNEAILSAKRRAANTSSLRGDAMFTEEDREGEEGRKIGEAEEHQQQPAKEGVGPAEDEMEIGVKFPSLTNISDKITSLFTTKVTPHKFNGNGGGGGDNSIVSYVFKKAAHLNALLTKYPAKPKPSIGEQVVSGTRALLADQDLQAWYQIAQKVVEKPSDFPSLVTSAIPASSWDAHISALYDDATSGNSDVSTSSTTLGTDGESNNNTIITEPIDGPAYANMFLAPESIQIPAPYDQDICEQFRYMTNYASRQLIDPTQTDKIISLAETTINASVSVGDGDKMGPNASHPEFIRASEQQQISDQALANVMPHLKSILEVSVNNARKEAKQGNRELENRLLKSNQQCHTYLSKHSTSNTDVFMKTGEFASDTFLKEPTFGTGPNHRAGDSASASTGEKSKTTSSPISDDDVWYYHLIALAEGQERITLLRGLAHMLPQLNIVHDDLLHSLELSDGDLIDVMAQPEVDIRSRMPFFHHHSIGANGSGGHGPEHVHHTLPGRNSFKDALQIIWRAYGQEALVSTLLSILPVVLGVLAYTPIKINIDEQKPQASDTGTGKSDTPPVMDLVRSAHINSELEDLKKEILAESKINLSLGDFDKYVNENSDSVDRMFSFQLLAGDGDDFLRAKKEGVCYDAQFEPIQSETGAVVSYNVTYTLAPNSPHSQYIGDIHVQKDLITSFNNTLMHAISSSVITYEGKAGNEKQLGKYLPVRISNVKEGALSDRLKYLSAGWAELAKLTGDPVKRERYERYQGYADQYLEAYIKIQLLSDSEYHIHTDTFNKLVFTLTPGGKEVKEAGRLSAALGLEKLREDEFRLAQIGAVYRVRQWQRSKQIHNWSILMDARQAMAAGPTFMNTVNVGAATASPETMKAAEDAVLKEFVSQITNNGTTITPLLDAIKEGGGVLDLLPFIKKQTGAYYENTFIDRIALLTNTFVQSSTAKVGLSLASTLTHAVARIAFKHLVLLSFIGTFHGLGHILGVSWLGTAGTAISDIFYPSSWAHGEGINIMISVTIQALSLMWDHIELVGQWGGYAIYSGLIFGIRSLSGGPALTEAEREANWKQAGQYAQSTLSWIHPTKLRSVIQIMPALQVLWEPATNAAIVSATVAKSLASWVYDAYKVQVFGGLIVTAMPKMGDIVALATGGFSIYGGVKLLFPILNLVAGLVGIRAIALGKCLSDISLLVKSVGFQRTLFWTVCCVSLLTANVAAKEGLKIAATKWEGFTVADLASGFSDPVGFFNPLYAELGNRIKLVPELFHLFEDHKREVIFRGIAFLTSVAGHYAILKAESDRAQRETTMHTREGAIVLPGADMLQDAVNAAIPDATYDVAAVEFNKTLARISEYDASADNFMKKEKFIKWYGDDRLFFSDHTKYEADIVGWWAAIPQVSGYVLRSNVDILKIKEAEDIITGYANFSVRAKALVEIALNVYELSELVLAQTEKGEPAPAQTSKHPNLERLPKTVHESLSNFKPEKSQYYIGTDPFILVNAPARPSSVPNIPGTIIATLEAMRDYLKLYFKSKDSITAPRAHRRQKGQHRESLDKNASSLLDMARRIITDQLTFDKIFGMWYTHYRTIYLPKTANWSVRSIDDMRIQQLLKAVQWRATDFEPLISSTFQNRLALTYNRTQQNTYQTRRWVYNMLYLFSVAVTSRSPPSETSKLVNVAFAGAYGASKIQG